VWLGSKNPYPKIQREQSHREQCERAGPLGTCLGESQTFFVDKRSDREGRQRYNREEKEAVEIQDEVREVVTPRLRSVQLGALTRCCGKDVVFDNVPWGNRELPVGEGVDSYDRNLISQVSGAKCGHLDSTNEYQGSRGHRPYKAQPSANHPSRLARCRDYVPGIEEEFLQHIRDGES